MLNYKNKSMDYNYLADCKTNSIIYNFFKKRSDDFGPIKIIKTPRNPDKRSPKTESDTSYSFAQLNGECKKNAIERIFGIDLSHILNIEKKLDYRILRIHSSALAALLCFHAVSEQNKIYFTIDKDLEFSRSEIEYCNKCKKGGPSKIDVALFNEQEKYVLFLEAKFSEYLDSNGGKISSQYKDSYLEFEQEEILPKKLVFTGLNEDGNIYIKSKLRGKGYYREGIKQLLSHYLGAQEFLKNNPEYTVYIGTVLFDFGERGETKLTDYSQLYEELAANFNKQPIKRIEFLSRIITYQELFCGEKYTKNSILLSDKVKTFYNLKV